jgi:DNA-binding HxlR family transcriptional regulator
VRSAWKTVADGWNGRIVNDLAGKTRFGQLSSALDSA